MKKYTIILFCVLITVVTLQCKKSEEDRIFKIYNVFGDVKIISNSVEITTKVGDIVNVGDTIVTGNSSLIDIIYAGNSIIRIAENSYIKISSLMDKTNNDTNFDMDHGKIYVTLSRLKKGEFKVKTPTIIASVRGTSFRVTVDENVSRLSVLSGKVKVNPMMNGEMIKNLEKIVEDKQVVEIDEKIVENLVKNKQDIKVANIKPEEMKEIKEDMKSIDSKVIEKLDNEIKKEFKEKVLQISGDTALKVEDDKKLKEGKKQQNLVKEKPERTAVNKLKEVENKKETVNKNEDEKKGIEKEKKSKDRASTIPTL